MTGIYLITNLKTNKVYVGQAVRLLERWGEHLRAGQPELYSSKNERDSNSYLHRSMNKYGINNFSFKILELCSREQLNEKEQQREKMQLELNELSEKYKAAKTEDEKKEIQNKMIDIRKDAFNLDDYYDTPKIEESLEPTTSFLKEVFVFVNFFSVSLLFVFLYMFPIKNILPGRAMIKSSKPEEATFILNIFLIYVFVYFIVVIVFNISNSLRSTLLSSFSITPDILDEIKKSEDPKEDAEKILERSNKNKSTFFSKGKTVLTYCVASAKYLVIITMVIIY